jgi:peptide/nickel transport system substrate-binding protein
MMLNEFLKIALTCLLLIGGCGPSSNPASLVVGLETFPSLEPSLDLDEDAQWVQELCFASLLSPNQDGSFSNELALSVEIQDNKAFIITLKEDLKFSDGSPLRAPDVVRAYQEALRMNSAESNPRGPTSVIQSIEALGPKRVVFRLKEPFAPFLSLATLGISKVSPTGGLRLASGPYAIEEILEGQQILLKRNPHGFGPSPENESVLFKVIPDESKRVFELKNAQIDIVQNDLALDILPSIQGDPGLEVKQIPNSSFSYVALNFHNPYLADIRVRQALNLAIDRKKIACSLYKDLVIPSDSLLPKGHLARHPQRGAPSYDPKKARVLMEDAKKDFKKRGLTLPFTLGLKVLPDPTTLRLAEAIQGCFMEIGVQLEVQAQERTLFFKEINSWGFDMYTLTWARIVDPDFYRALFFSSSLSPLGDNRGFYTNPFLDDLLLRACTAYDRETRRELYWRVQEVLSQDLPYLNLWHGVNTIVHRKGIVGIQPDPLGTFRFLLTSKRSS